MTAPEPESESWNRHAREGPMECNRWTKQVSVGCWRGPDRILLRMSQTLILGTAQWGLDYGITNASGRVTDVELRAVIRVANDLGINCLDTAPGYGDAESRIGMLAPEFLVQSKVQASGIVGDSIHDQVRKSLGRLRRSHIWRVLVHDWPSLDAKSARSAIEELADLRSGGVVGQIGVSVYETQDLQLLLELDLPIDVVQVPMSILDQRLLNCVELSELREQGASIQARSIFLQGVMLDQSRLSRHSSHIDVVRLHEGLDGIDVDPVTAAVSFVRSVDAIDEVVAGFTNQSELEAFWSAWTKVLVHHDWAKWASRDEELLDPRRWD